MKNTAMQERLGEEIKDFINSRRSLQLATVDEDGAPFASYAPFAADDDSFYVLLSDIACTGCNLAREPRASVLVIEDEDTCRGAVRTTAGELPGAGRGARGQRSGLEAAVELLAAAPRRAAAQAVAARRLPPVPPAPGQGPLREGLRQGLQPRRRHPGPQAIDHLREGKGTSRGRSRLPRRPAPARDRQ
jgi:hypothetical protein